MGNREGTPDAAARAPSGRDERANETLRCVGIAPGGETSPFDRIHLPHAERRVRRAVLTLGSGDRVALDLPDAVTLRDRDRLVLEDGREVEVVAAAEPLLEVTAPDAAHLAELAWHLGNRHAAARIEAARILVAHDPVLARMLEGLGATVREVREAFEPLRGAYHSHDHGHAE